MHVKLTLFVWAFQPSMKTSKEPHER